MAIEKKTVPEWLNEVNYDFPDYEPSVYSIKFINFIKLVNFSKGGEENKSPLVHMKMLDNVFNGNKRTGIMCHRGIGKSSVMAEYLFLYIATFGKLDNFGKVDLAIYVSDSIENGVKNLRRNIEYRYEESDFLKEHIPYIRFTDTRLEFQNKDGHTFIVKNYGAKALSLDSKLYTDNGFTTIGECKVGDKIYGPDGKLCTITKKSEIFNKPMYKIKLLDGREIKVSEDHINSVQVNENPNGITKWVDRDYTTKELLQLPLRKEDKKRNSGRGLIAIKNTEPVKYSDKDLPIDPYVLGLLLGDGSMKKDGSNTLHAHIDDMKFYKKNIPYELGKPYIDKRNGKVESTSIKGLSQKVRDLGVNIHGDFKFIPEIYQRGSIKQRMELLKGLMDTDGTISITSRMSFCSNSVKLAEGVAELVRSLGGEARINKSNKAYKVEIKILQNIFKLPRKAKRFKQRVRTTNRVPIVSIERIEDEPSQCIAVDNKLHQFLTDNYVRTHNTGVRGSKEKGIRPQLAVLDDLVSDEDARSQTIIGTIEDTVHKAVSKALHPTKSKTIWLGTPFNQGDPLYKAIESGAWNVSVYPVAEEFNAMTTKDTFKSSWPDRFTYEYVKDEYDSAEKQGKLDGFYQELMLQVISDEERVIHDEDIVEYDFMKIKDNLDEYNIYITTDFATSEKSSADYSAISVWAVNNNGDWMWIDGICSRQLMNKNIDQLFKFVQIYKPMSVGIEVTGQQGGFVSWIKNEMLNRNIYFNLASANNSHKEGIRPRKNKLERMLEVQPRFKQKKVWFPENHKKEVIAEMMIELKAVTMSGIKSKHDDMLDTISMMADMPIIAPSTQQLYKYDSVSGSWLDDDLGFDNNSYIID